MATKKISAIAATGSGGTKTTQTAIPDYNANATQTVNAGINPAALGAAVAAGRITAEQARAMMAWNTPATAQMATGGLTPAQLQLKAEAEARQRAAQAAQAAQPTQTAATPVNPAALYAAVAAGKVTPEQARSIAAGWGIQAQATPISVGGAASQTVNAGINPAALYAAVAAGKVTPEQARAIAAGQMTPQQAMDANTVPDYSAVLNSLAQSNPQVNSNTVANLTVPTSDQRSAQMEKARADTIAGAAKRAQEEQAGVPNYNDVLHSLAERNPQVSADTVSQMTVPEYQHPETRELVNYNEILKSLARDNPQVSADTVSQLMVPDASGYQQPETRETVNYTDTQMPEDRSAGTGSTSLTENSAEDTGDSEYEEEPGKEAEDETNSEAEDETENETDSEAEDEAENETEDETDYRSILDSYDSDTGRDPYYENRFRELLGKLEAYPEFQYDQNSDPVWAALAKQYRREGQRATADTLGQYAAMTGGIPSSAAVTAASQAGNYYAGQLSDRLPEVYQQAYQRYLDEYSRLYGLTGDYLNGWNATEDQYLNDRNFAYQQYLNDRDFAYQQAADQQNFDYKQQSLDYQRYLDDRDFTYRQEKDQRDFAYQQEKDQRDYDMYESDGTSLTGDGQTPASESQKTQKSATISGVTHENGKPMSAAFPTVWSRVRNLYDAKDYNGIASTIEYAIRNNDISPDEADIMLDKLGIPKAG